MSEIDLLIKLFDTLKDASKETQQLCHAMLTNQNNIGNYIKGLPMVELREALKDHSKESSDSIGVCTETVENKSDNILERVKSIEGKIGKMITVVVVAFTLFSAALLFGSLIIQSQKDKDPHHGIVEQYEKKIKEMQDHHNDQIEELKQEMRDLHQ